MLSKHDQTFGLFGDCLSHETTVVVEAVNVAFIACVEKDWSGRWVPESCVNQITNVEFRTVTTSVKMINLCFEEKLLNCLCLTHCKCSDSRK